MSEELFWHRMNPARLHALYNAKFRSGLHLPPRPQTEEQERESLRADGKWGNLSEYLGGG